MKAILKQVPVPTTIITLAVAALGATIAIAAVYLDKGILPAVNLPQTSSTAETEQLAIQNQESAPALADERVDLSLGHPQARVLPAQAKKAAAQQTTTQTSAALQIATSPTGNPITYPISNLPCDIVFDFLLTDTSNGQGTYELVVTNKGHSTCDQATLTVYYTDGERYVSSSPLPTAGGYYWKLGNMGSGAQSIIALTTQGARTLPGGTEGCATAYNGTDSCAHARASGSVNTSPTPTPTPTTTPTPTSAPTNTPAPTPVPTVVSSGNAPVPAGKIYGVWVWDDVYGMSDAKMRSIVNNAASGNFTVIYLTVDKYIELNALPAGTSKTNQINTYIAALAKFIGLANAQGMDVMAEAGWKDWVNGTNRTKPVTILNFVANFNKTQTVKFAGVQYDIEPYLLSTYEKNKASVLTSFVTLVGDIVNTNKSTQLTLEFVIPHFYDCLQNWTPKVTYNGKSDCTFNHLLNLLDQSPNSTISIMAYRNFAEGNNSTIAISQEEVKQAAGHPTKVIIAQETGDVDPSYVTYYGTSETYLMGQLGKIVNKFQGMDGFGGLAIHYLDPYIALIQ